MKAKQPFERELDNEPLTEKSDHIQVPGLTGTWYVIDKNDGFGPDLFLLEDEEYGDEASCCIVDRWGNLVWSGVYNSWDDLQEAVDDQVVMFVHHLNTITKKSEWKIYREVGWKGAFG